MKSFLEEMNRPACYILPPEALSKMRPRRRPPMAEERRNFKAKVAVVQQRVADFYGVDLDELLSAKRGPEAASWARHVAMFMVLQLLRASLNDAGKVFHRDHTTCLHARQSVQSVASVYREVRAELDQIRMLLESDLAAL